MFESVAPDLAVRPNRRVFYESLPISIALHAAAVAGVTLSFLAHVAFPSVPPRTMVSYLLVAEAAAVPPPPPPARPAARRGTAPAVPTTAPSLVEQMAPSVIPDTVPVLPVVPPAGTVAPAQGTASTADGGGGAAEGGDPVHGVEGGVVGGSPNGIAGGVLLPDGRVHFDRSAFLPMMSIRYEIPEYPEMLRRQRIEGDVIVRYIVGMDGNVREAKVIDPSPEREFNEAAVQAISRWRFRPLSLDGVKREVVHEVLVSFRLQ